MSDKRNGQQIGAENFEAFRVWIAQREGANDWANYIRRGVLNRSEIASECGFDRKVFATNPSIKAMLAQLEIQRAEYFNSLEASGSNEDVELIQQNADLVSNQRAAASRSKLDARVKSLEERNASLVAEVNALRLKLSQYRHIDEHLADTGRLLQP